jgi:hypothetical protein
VDHHGLRDDEIADEGEGEDDDGEAGSQDSQSLLRRLVAALRNLLDDAALNALMKTGGGFPKNIAEVVPPGVVVVPGAPGRGIPGGGGGGPVVRPGGGG